MCWVMLCQDCTHLCAVVVVGEKGIGSPGCTRCCHVEALVQTEVGGYVSACNHSAASCMCRDGTRLGLTSCPLHCTFSHPAKRPSGGKVIIIAGSSLHATEVGRRRCHLTLYPMLTLQACWDVKGRLWLVGGAPVNISSSLHLAALSMEGGWRLEAAGLLAEDRGG